jgi:hypothetical protein
MLRIPSRRCQAKRSNSESTGLHVYRHPKGNARVSPIKTSTKVPLTVAPHPPTLRDVGHQAPCRIGKSLSKGGAVEVCAKLIH